jgi:hypothetical protein
MAKFLTPEKALKMMIGLLIAVVLFHLSVLFQLVPYTIVWAGKLNTLNEMYAFEAVSIAINLFLLLILALKGNYIKHNIAEKWLNGILWFFVVVFALNTVGNLMAETAFEKIVFTPLTLISALLIWIILKKK